MSTRFEAVNSEYASVSGVALAGAGIAIPVRFYLHSLPSTGNYYCLVTVYGSFQGFGVYVNADGKLRIYDYNADALNANIGATTLAVDTWYELWIRCADDFDPVRLYLNESTTPDLSTTGNFAIPATATIQFATNQVRPRAAVGPGGVASAVYADVSLCGGKLWGADLAATNAPTEFADHDLVSTTNGLAAWHFDGTDVSDHFSTLDLTASGTLSAGPDSPIDGGGGGPSFQPAWARYSNILIPVAA